MRAGKQGFFQNRAEKLPGPLSIQGLEIRSAELLIGDFFNRARRGADDINFPFGKAFFELLPHIFLETSNDQAFKGCDWTEYGYSPAVNPPNRA